MNVASQISIPTLLRRAIRRKCPRCGNGQLFKTWVGLHEKCESCDLKILQNQGDPWAIQVATDRLFLFPVIALIYFGFAGSSSALFAAACIVILVIFLVTTPHRYAIAVTIDYIVRQKTESDPES